MFDKSSQQTYFGNFAHMDSACLSFRISLQVPFFLHTRRHHGGCIHLYYYGKVCLQHHDLLNYQTDLFKTDIFRKLMIQH
jgi:hypothetical protein